jgi:hypothetical protein
MQKHRNKAVEELWKEENEKEVSTFYRLTQDLRELNQKTVEDLYIRCCGLITYSTK